MCDTRLPWPYTGSQAQNNFTGLLQQGPDPTPDHTGNEMTSPIPTDNEMPCQCNGVAGRNDLHWAHYMA